MCILLVEDEPPIREIAQEFLEEAGHEVVAAEHGLAACDHVDRYPGRFDCLVTDFNMPGGVNGGGVIEHVRAAYPAIPIILASAYPEATTAEWRAQHRVHRLDKPYSMSALIGLLERLLP